MSRYEVTQQLYCWITGEYPSYFATRGGYTDDFSRPVESVTWLDAVNFCNDLSTFTGFMPCYAIDELTGVVTCDFTADGYRLPTEAEWEYAARGGTANDGYYFLYAGSDDPSEVAWWGDPTGTTHPVGYKGSNELGLYDMTGNVYEWCWDTYDDTYYSWPTVVWFDPIGPGGIYAYDAANFPGYYMVVRGGSFGNGADPGLDWLRNPGRSYRAQEWANSASSIIGFRVVRRL
jgi:formylglycine-generating enzyme required for sulfatase activity